MKTNPLLINKSKIDLTKLKANLIPSEDIKRVVKKILTEYKIESLPSIVRSFDLSDIVPSEFTVIKCFAIMKNYVSSNRDIRHPVYYLENVLENSDVVYQNTGIKFEDKIVSSKMGMIADNPMAFYAGAASTVLNYYTREDNRSITKTFVTPAYLGVMKLDDVNLEDIRASVKTNLSSVTLSRETHYETFMLDTKNAIHVIDRIYSAPKLNDYAISNDRAKEVSQAVSNENQLQYIAKGNVPCVVDCDFDLKDNTTLEQAWLIAAISRSQIGGEKAGMGALTSGYYAFDMPTNVVKALARAREVIAMLKLLRISVVKIAATKDFSLLSMQLLARNGIRVISSFGAGLCKKDSPPGIYASSDVSYLTIVANSFQEPKFNASGMTYQSRDSFEDSFAGVFSKKKKGYTAVLTYYTPALMNKIKSMDEKTMSFFPSLSPHTGKIWLINCVLDLNIFDEEHIKRFVKSVYFKNLYPLTRKPYFTFDPLRTLFPESVIIPKVVRADKKSVISIPTAPARVLNKEDVIKIDCNYDFMVAREFAYDPVPAWKKEVDKIMLCHDPADLAESLTYIYNLDDPEYWELVIIAMKGTDNIDAKSVFDMIILQSQQGNALPDVPKSIAPPDKPVMDADLLQSLAELSIKSKKKED